MKAKDVLDKVKILKNKQDKSNNESLERYRKDYIKIVANVFIKEKRNTLEFYRSYGRVIDSTEPFRDCYSIEGFFSKDLDFFTKELIKNGYHFEYEFHSLGYFLNYFKISLNPIPKEEKVSLFQKLFGGF